MPDDRITAHRMEQMLRAVFAELDRAGGRARPKAIFAAVEPRLNLTKYEQELNKSGYTRWETAVRFYTIDCVKAGYMRRSSGHWILTDEGKNALSLPQGQLIRTAQEEYRAWRKAKEEADAESEEAERQTSYEKAVESAQAEIERHIKDLDPYDFQKLVAELLRAMGYYVPFVASPGPDGGVDVQAYKDPLGTTTPRIKVQVKHRDQKVSAKEVRELEGLLRKEGDIGLLVSSGGFTSDAEREIRSSVKHIETMDVDRLVELWQAHYDDLNERGKSLLPLVKVYFLAPTEE